MKKECCDKPKVKEIRVRSPEGVHLFQLCDDHLTLDYFRKYRMEESS